MEGFKGRREVDTEEADEELVMLKVPSVLSKAWRRGKGPGDAVARLTETVDAHTGECAGLVPCILEGPRCPRASFLMPSLSVSRSHSFPCFVDALSLSLALSLLLSLSLSLLMLFLLMLSLS